MISQEVKDTRFDNSEVARSNSIFMLLTGLLMTGDELRKLLRLFPKSLFTTILELFRKMIGGLIHRTIFTLRIKCFILKSLLNKILLQMIKSFSFHNHKNYLWIFLLEIFSFALIVPIRQLPPRTFYFSSIANQLDETSAEKHFLWPSTQLNAKQKGWWVHIVRDQMIANYQNDLRMFHFLSCAILMSRFFSLASRTCFNPIFIPYRPK